MIIPDEILSKQPDPTVVVSHKSDVSAISEYFQDPERTTRKLTKSLFDHLLTRVFSSFASEGNSNYIENRWLSVKFEEFLVAKKHSQLYNELFTMVSTFYTKHPFDLEMILTKAMSTFFLHYPSLWELAKNKVVNINDDLELVIRNYFVPRFKKHITAAMLGNAKYKSVRQIITSSLRTLIEQRVKKFTPAYSIPNDSRFARWIDSYNYKAARKIGMTKAYDSFFQTQNPNTLFSFKEKTFRSLINIEIENNLELGVNSPLLQVFYHFLFASWFRSGQIKLVEKQYLSNAQQLVSENANDNAKNLPDSSFQNSLEAFFPGLKSLVEKFGLTYVANTNLPSQQQTGIMFTKLPNYEYLVPTDATRARYDFRFQLQFVTSHLDANQNHEPHRFQIRVDNVISPFDQAKNIVETLRERIVWNSGYRGLNNWNVKEFVKWLDDFKTDTDFYNFIYSPRTGIQRRTKTLKENEWTHFSPTHLQLDFSPINSKFSFEIEPVIEFVENGYEKRAYEDQDEANFDTGDKRYNNVLVYGEIRLGNVRFFLRLKQYSGGTNEKKLVRKHDFRIKDQSEIFSVGRTVLTLVIQQFPQLINYDQWSSKGNKMWLNEFLDSDGNEAMLPTMLNEWTKRTNVQEIYDYTQELVRDLNQSYNSNFVMGKIKFYDHFQKHNKSIKAFSFTGNNKEDKSRYFTIIHALSLRKLSAFDDVKSGFFQRKAVDSKMTAGLKTALLLKPNPDELETGEPLPPEAVFIVDINRWTLKSIIEYFQNLGFKKVLASNIWAQIIGRIKEENKLSSNDYITMGFGAMKEDYFSEIYYHHKRFWISYEIPYYDFTKGAIGIKKKEIKIPLFLENKYEFVPPSEMQADYDEIIKSLTPEQRNSAKLRKQITEFFSKSKIKQNGVWRNDIRRYYYERVMAEFNALLRGFNPESALATKLKKLFNGKIPDNIATKMANPEYQRVFEQILANSSHLSKQNLLRIFRNDKFMNLLKAQGSNHIKKIMHHYSKVSKTIKYAYLGSGIGFGIIGLLAGITTLKTTRLAKQAKQSKLKFRKIRGFSLFSLVSTIITFTASTIFTLLFIIEKGGF